MLINIYYPEKYRDFFGSFGIFPYLCNRQTGKNRKTKCGGTEIYPIPSNSTLQGTGFSWFLQIFLVNMSKNNKV